MQGKTDMRAAVHYAAARYRAAATANCEGYMMRADSSAKSPSL